MPLYDLDNRIRAFGESRRLNVGTASKPRWITNVHAGDDYAETYGHDDVHAVQPGVVTVSGWSSTFGWHVKARTPDGTIIGYHSLEEASSLKKGDTVRPGDFVGRTGDSASGASGNHVHIQADTPKGKAFNPRPYISGFSAVGGAVAFDNTEVDDMPDMNEFLNTAAYDGGPSISALFKAIDGRTPPEIAKAIWWGSTVDRPAGHVEAIQELADSKTILVRLEAQLSAMNAAVSALAVAKGVDPETLAAMIASKVDAALADNFASIPDAVRTNIKGAL